MISRNSYLNVNKNNNIYETMVYDWSTSVRDLYLYRHEQNMKFAITLCINLLFKGNDHTYAIVIDTEYGKFLISSEFTDDYSIHVNIYDCYDESDTGYSYSTNPNFSQNTVSHITDKYGNFKYFSILLATGKPEALTLRGSYNNLISIHEKYDYYNQSALNDYMRDRKSVV